MEMLVAKENELVQDAQTDDTVEHFDDLTIRLLSLTGDYKRFRTERIASLNVSLIEAHLAGLSYYTEAKNRTDGLSDRARAIAALRSKVGNYMRSAWIGRLVTFLLVLNYIISMMMAIESFRESESMRSNLEKVYIVMAYILMVWPI